MRRIILVTLVAVMTGCGSDKKTTTPVPPDAAAMQTFQDVALSAVFPGLGQIGAILPLVVNQGSPAAELFHFQPDPTPGAPANSFVFVLPVDANGDGTNDATAEGKLHLSGDPATAGVGFGGSVELALDNPAGTGQFAGNFEIIEGGTRLSGTGTLDDAISGNSIDVTITPEKAIVAKVATGEPAAQPNACPYSLSGTAEVGISGPLGTLMNDLVFSSSQRAVRIQNAVYIDHDANETDLPDRSVEVSCGTGSVNDWAGVYLFDWSCIPQEYGQSLVTITVSGNTIHIVDEDPPASGDILEYSATATAGNPHVVRGYFDTAPGPGQYREYFSWVMAPDGNTFTQVSAYAYSGAFGGLCSANAVRQP